VLYVHLYFFLRTVAVFVVMVAADTADRSCEEQRRMINKVLCISRRTSFLLPLVLSPAGSFYTVILILREYSLSNFLGAAIHRLVHCNFSRLGHSLISVSQDTHDGNDHPRTTGSEEAACSAPRFGQNANNCSIV
jgi:hypothetical protein